MIPGFDSLSPEFLAPHLVVAGFDGLDLPPAVAEALAQGLAGVALFKRNIRDVDQVRALTRAIREAARPFAPPIISVDQEGGKVQRLRGLVTDRPAMAVVGRGTDQTAMEVGQGIGRDLAGLGFNLDFAPVLDIDTNPTNPIIGDRAFGGSAETVAQRAIAFLKGIETTGVLGCGKHFPGHGDASVDSHLDLPVIDINTELWAGREAIPFRTAISDGIPMIMTAHCLYPKIDPDVPATLSRPIVRGLLREQLGFSGCVITDDLGMKAISERFESIDVLRLGLSAGVDLFMHCGAGGEAFGYVDGVVRGLQSGVLSRDDVVCAARRVYRLRQSLME